MSFVVKSVHRTKAAANKSAKKYKGSLVTSGPIRSKRTLYFGYAVNVPKRRRRR